MRYLAATLRIPQVTSKLRHTMYHGVMATDPNPFGPNPGVALEFTLGDRLRKAREHAGLEIQQLAEAVDVHRQSVTRYETDRAVPKRGTVLLWSIATGVSVNWLETGEPTHASELETSETAV